MDTILLHTLADLHSKIKSQRSYLEKIMGYIPLYHGYKEKELRRESDRILRNHIYQILNDAKSNLKKSEIEFVQNNKMKFVKKTENLLTKCDTIAQKINHAPAGYSGFWDATKIKEKELDRLYEMDSSLAILADNIFSSTKDFHVNVSENEITEKLTSISKNIESFDTQITTRREFLMGYSE